MTNTKDGVTRTGVSLKRLLVFPNDPIHRYVEKGEVKPRYFNPADLFDEVHVVTFSDQVPPREAIQPFAGRASIVIHPLGSLRGLLSPAHPTRFPAALLALDRLVRRIRPSVIRGYNSALEGFLAVWFARRYRTPSIISLHIDRDEVRRHERLRLRHRVFEQISRRWFEPYAVRHADVVLPVSEFLEQYARRYGAMDIRVIYNRVYTVQFHSPAARLPRSGRFRILSVGRLDPQKQQECLIRAIREIPDVELVLIGDGVRRGALQSLAERLGVRDRVRMIPSVPHAEIPRWYWDADMFAIASRYEGFCIPILEAMAAGLPVVVNDKAPLPEIVGGAGIVVANTPTAFRDAFARLRDDPALRQQLRERALRRAQELDGAQFEAREADVYRSLMGGA